MRVMLYKEARDHFDEVLERVVTNHEMLIIARKNNKSIVILPFEDWIKLKRSTDGY